MHFSSRSFVCKRRTQRTETRGGFTAELLFNHTLLVHSHTPRLDTLSHLLLLLYILDTIHAQIFHTALVFFSTGDLMCVCVGMCMYAWFPPSACDSWRTTWETLRTSEYLMWSIWELCIRFYTLLYLHIHSTSSISAYSTAWRRLSPHPPLYFHHLLPFQAQTDTIPHIPLTHKSDGERFNSNENERIQTRSPSISHEVSSSASNRARIVSIVVVSKTVNECVFFGWVDFRFGFIEHIIIVAFLRISVAI